MKQLSVKPNHTILALSIAVWSLFLSGLAYGDDMRVATFNTESAADTHWFEVATTIRDAGRVDVWLLQEVESEQAAARYAEAAAAWGGNSYRFVVSESGANISPHRSNDHLAVVYNSTKLRHIETVELHSVRSVPGDGPFGEPKWRLRGALFVRLYDRSTNVEFYVGNVHLKCCDAGKDTRTHQTKLLRNWVDRSDVPVILAGDFNISISPQAENSNLSSTAFTNLNDAMTWLRPTNPTKTQCSPRYNSMLDHFFLKAQNSVTVKVVEILQPDPAYCDAEAHGGADHRPVLGAFTFGK